MSQDVFLGGPYNHAFYATFTHLIAHILGIKAEKMIYVTGDTHLYSNHLEQAKLQLTRDPYESPTISIDKSIIDFGIQFTDAICHKIFKCNMHRDSSSIYSIRCHSVKHVRKSNYSQKIWHL